MATGNTSSPGLPPRIAKLLLDKLETDNDFRAAFAQSPEQALRAIGHADAMPCLTLKAGQTLASPEQIRAQRAKLEELTTGIQNMTCPLAAQTITGL
ncbi:MAG: NHLP-related RiPP peptide [Xanthomonadaceae bacterium]|nr:NHLP-related RiPP peptide [Xanthomonadaceae bacterium]